MAEASNLHAMVGLKRCKKCCFFALISLAIIYIIFMTIQTRIINPLPGESTKQCLVPNVDPFHETVKKFYRKSENYHCDGKPSFIEIVDGNILKINKDILKSKYKTELGKCSYQAIQRKVGEFSYPDDRVVFEDRKNSTFNDKIEAKDEFLKIVCQNNRSEVFFEEMRALIIKKPKVEEKYEKIKKKYPGKRMSVLVFSIDSVSRLNFIRHFPKTRKFLQEKDAIELLSYNKVGEATIDNMIPFLTGNFLSYYWEDGQPSNFDHVDVLWKYYASRGYYTMSLEDAPDWGLFNYEKTGFYNPPTDYYYRPFATALEVSKRRKHSTHHCIGNEMEFKFILDWSKMFTKKFKNDQYFQWAFLTRISHNYLNHAGYADKPTVDFFKDLYEAKVLNDTLVVFMSDHGIRYGDIRKTKIGKMEENTPFFYILLPDWFKKSNPQILDNLKTNQKRLTTPFDAHEMLKELVDYKIGKPFPLKDQSIHKSHGISLFHEIPKSRTCEDASIPKSYCSCDFYVDSDDLETGTKVSQLAVVKINSNLEKHFDKCAKLELSKVISSKYQKGFAGNPEYHQVIFEVSPSEAQYEATATVSGQVFKLVGDVTRVNRYHKQSECVHSRFLKPYCFCKSILSKKAPS